MKVQEFISVLENNTNKELIFEYAPNKIAGANYHLTEVKNVQFNTTDCGGKTNFWKETHFQIWESPNEMDKTEFMTVNKILSIVKRVDAITPLLLGTELKIEYGNSTFPTSVMPIQKINSTNKQLIISLFVENTRCKANDICGIPEVEEKDACCETSGCC